MIFHWIVRVSSYIYDKIIVLRTYQLLQICNVILVVNFGSDILVSSNDNTAMIITMNAYFWHIWETQTQKEPVQCINILKFGRKMLYRITSLMIILLSSYIAYLGPHVFSGLTVLQFMLAELLIASYHNWKVTVISTSIKCYIWFKRLLFIYINRC